MKFLISLILVVFLYYSSLASDERKVLIDLTTGDLKKIEKYLLNGLTYNIEYYKNHLISLDVVVAIHGDAYKFFIKDLKKSPYKNETEIIKKQLEIYNRLKTLHDIYNVKFEICEAGLKSRKIDVKNIYEFVKPVKTIFITLVDYQNKGYAYIPIK